MYPRLVKSCEEAIKKEWCLGCQALENPNFTGKLNCEGSHPPETKKSKESINEIHKILNVKEKYKDVK